MFVASSTGDNECLFGRVYNIVFLFFQLELIFLKTYVNFNTWYSSFSGLICGYQYLVEKECKLISIFGWIVRNYYSVHFVSCEWFSLFFLHWPVNGIISLLWQSLSLCDGHLYVCNLIFGQTFQQGHLPFSSIPFCIGYLHLRRCKTHHAQWVDGGCSAVLEHRFFIFSLPLFENHSYWLWFCFVSLEESLWCCHWIDDAAISLCVLDCNGAVTNQFS